MRIFVKACVAAAALVTALAPIAHAQTKTANATNAPSAQSAPAAAAPRQAPVFSAYHGVTPGKQTERLNTLRNQGYRPITLTVDNAAAPRYGAVWVQTPGAPWVMYQGMTSNGYQNRFNARVADGYRPTSVSASGSGTPRSSPRSSRRSRGGSPPGTTSTPTSSPRPTRTTPGADTCSRR
ncbi:hypothetical protein ACFQX6_36225 [Streptosporangium lutulentum]